MKAADALFSGTRAEPQQHGDGTRAVPSQTPWYVPDHQPSGRNGAPARSTADADAVFAAVEPASQLERETPASGGRILQAIEAAPAEDPFAALEAERAPKRRGRKPGSKNKPKLPGSVSAAALDMATKTLNRSQRTPTQRRASQRLDAGARTEAIVALLAEPANPAPIAMPARRTPAVTATAGKQRDRFAWVRTKLQPGEKWKRRLPKVAW